MQRSPERRFPLPLALTGNVLYAIPQTFGIDGIREKDSMQAYMQVMLPLGYQAEKKYRDETYFMFADLLAWMAGAGLLIQLLRPDLFQGPVLDIHKFLPGLGITALSKLPTNFVLNAGNNIVETVRDRVKSRTSRRKAR